MLPAVMAAVSLIPGRQFQLARFASRSEGRYRASYAPRASFGTFRRRSEKTYWRIVGAGPGSKALFHFVQAFFVI